MSNERNIIFTFNFNAPVGQNIAHVDKLEAHFDKDMTMQVVDTKSIVNDEMEEATQPTDTPDSVSACFKFGNDFVKEAVEKIVKAFYLDKPVNLAMIEVVLYDHGLLYKRNQHTQFIHALVDWGILSDTTDISKAASCMASKLRNPFPSTGYKDWNNAYLNDRNLCVEMGKMLPDSIKYNR